MAIISFASAESGAGWAGRSRGDSELSYRRAQRHSRRVRRLRVGLLIATAMLLFWVVADNYLPTGGLRLPGEIGGLVIKGTKITMQEPRLTGFTSDARAYEFSANAAAQDITKPDFVELQRIRAKLEMADKSMVHMWADTGILNLKTNMLTLDDNIHLISSTGYEARLGRAVIDISKGNVVSATPVWVKLLDGFLNAKRLEIVDSGNVVRFTDVKMTLQSGGHNSKAEQP